MAEFDVMGIFEENKLLIYVFYALVIGYFVGKNRNTIKQGIHNIGHEIDMALCTLFGWFEERTVNKKSNPKYDWWSLMNFYLVIWVLLFPLTELDFYLIVWLPITILAFVVAFIFLFFEFQFTKNAFGSEIIEEDKAVE
ncbi:hypothetical protein KAU43_04265 [candidate division WOR-3 bacterium]|nr:hypothetical protein [candidate division WOR-3 bacterium]